MEEPESNLYGVLGRRLTYLSEHPDVRDYILTRVQQEQNDPRQIAQNITVRVNDEDLTFNVPGDARNVFIANLNKLLPDPPKGGDRYAQEVDETFDSTEHIQHDWTVWDTMLTQSPRLRARLRAAIIAVLGHQQRVRVYGRNRPQTDVISLDSNDPQLIFQVPPRYTDKGMIEEPQPGPDS